MLVSIAPYFFNITILNINSNKVIEAEPRQYVQYEWSINTCAPVNQSDMSKPGIVRSKLNLNISEFSLTLFVIYFDSNRMSTPITIDR